jgi:hypothetical protein
VTLFHSAQQHSLHCFFYDLTHGPCAGLDCLD